MTWPTTPAADECGQAPCVDCGEMIDDSCVLCDECERTREATNGEPDMPEFVEYDEDGDAEEYD